MLPRIRLGFLLLSFAAFGWPAAAEAQLSPWYDYTVGYTPYYTGYTPYYAGYSSYSGYYGPYTTSYAPGIGCSSCGCGSACGYGGCSTCGSAPCSTCGYGCSTGNCASGNCATGNCGTTTTNLAPNGTIAPVPDPGVQSRTLERRLEVIEKKLNIPTSGPSRARTYEEGDDFARPGRAPTPGTTTTPDEDPNYPAPRRRGGAGGGSEMFEENPGTGTRNESNRVPLEHKSLGVPEDVIIPSKKPAPGPPIEESPTTTLRLDHRITSRAVSPRERNNTAATAVVASRKEPAARIQLDVRLDSNDVARQ